MFAWTWGLPSAHYKTSYGLNSFIVILFSNQGKTLWTPIVRYGWDTKKSHIQMSIGGLGFMGAQRRRNTTNFKNLTLTSHNVFSLHFHSYRHYHPDPNWLIYLWHLHEWCSGCHLICSSECHVTAEGKRLQKRNNYLGVDWNDLSFIVIIGKDRNETNNKFIDNADKNKRCLAFSSNVFSSLFICATVTRA